MKWQFLLFFSKIQALSENHSLRSRLSAASCHPSSSCCPSPAPGTELLRAELAKLAHERDSVRQQLTHATMVSHVGVMWYDSFVKNKNLLRRLLRTGILSSILGTTYL